MVSRRLLLANCWGPGLPLEWQTFPSHFLHAQGMGQGPRSKFRRVSPELSAEVAFCRDHHAVERKREKGPSYKRLL